MILFICIRVLGLRLGALILLLFFSLVLGLRLGALVLVFHSKDLLKTVKLRVKAQPLYTCFVKTHFIIMN